RDESYPQQDAFVMDTSPRVLACTTRRAGKSTGIALRFLRTLAKHRGATCRYIALTRDSARDIMWLVLEEINERFRLGATLRRQALEMVLPNGGGMIKLYGADMQNLRRGLKGAKSPAVAIDEAQDFNNLEELIETVLEPTLADYRDSWLGLTGTPGIVPSGYFFDASRKVRGDYSVHSWSLFDNPYLPDPRSFVEKTKLRSKWSDNHPALLREYYGQWVTDKQSLLIRYDSNRNHYDELPKVQWHYILGVDLGYRDADALAVLAWSESLPTVYLVHEETARKQDLTELAHAIQRLISRYDPSKIVMDYGGLGKKIIEEYRRRWQIPVQEADKQRKWENVELLNDFLSQGKFFAKKDGVFAQDSYKVQIDWDKSKPDHYVEKAGFHSDIIDSVLYAFRESPAYTWRATPPKPKYGTPAWQKEQEDEMEQAAV